MFKKYVAGACSALSALMLSLAPFKLYAQSPPPMALPKSGSCPSGYVTNGAYCAPLNHARFAVAKTGSCPSGYVTSGAYCLALDNARLAVPKVGSCPSGYVTSGSYCLQMR